LTSVTGSAALKTTFESNLDHGFCLQTNSCFSSVIEHYSGCLIEFE